ncbi:MAG: indole-3-glycerol phosphate synthase TrpC [Dehalococcoidia bacterium]|nr:indole-3-glycerol phosphate synthase TrpC [Dehalococcoidia bacterium]
MATILDEIVASKRREVEESKGREPLEALEERIASQPPALNLSGALLGDRVRLIAEVKKASPSRGLLAPDFDPVRLATTYVDNGAAAVSVLTDPRFQGTLEDLAAVKASLAPSGAPVLRKDFTFDPYQVYEARAHGADAILLIVSILSPADLKHLLALARRFWMQCLVEVHAPDELETALEAGAEIIGINNRDLRTFHTSLSVTEELAPRVPRGRVVVSESGISQPDHMRALRRLGVHAALVGEAIVTAADVGARVRELAGP